MNNTLNEKIESYIKDKKYGPISESNEKVMAHLLKNTALAANGELMNEAVMSGDIAQFTPILMPVVRRVFPMLVANQLLGVQPLSTPTGYVYALVNRYAGTKTDSIVADKAQVIVFSSEVTKGATISYSDKSGKIIHVEADKKTALVQLTKDKLFEVGNSTSPGGSIKAVYSNEATFHKILESYTGPYNTAAGEKLADDMTQVGFNIEKKSVEAITRKLKAEYTLEMYEDLKNQHGILADQHLTDLISAEIQTEIDRDIINFVNNIATVVPDAISPGNSHKDSGRWEIERYRANAVKIDLEARNIGIMTKRGSGNVLVVSPKVATMLEQIGSFFIAKEPANISNDIFTGNVGTFNNRYKVIVDQYAVNDYVTVAYKGATAQDALGFFCPYVPLSLQKVMNPDSGQPGFIARTRYAKVYNPLEPQNYARTMSVNLTGTILA